MGGYSGRCLRVELAGGKIDSFQVPEKAQRAVIGGSGLGAWLLLQRARPRASHAAASRP
jgi:aldehyde:ferredoxin oxidoreductase